MSLRSVTSRSSPEALDDATVLSPMPYRTPGLVLRPGAVTAGSSFELEQPMRVAASRLTPFTRSCPRCELHGRNSSGRRVTITRAQLSARAVVQRRVTGSSRLHYPHASALAMSPRPAPLQRYATAAIHPTDSSEKPAALKSRSRSVMPAKARSVSIEPPPRPGLQRQATTAVNKIHEAQTWRRRRRGDAGAAAGAAARALRAAEGDGDAA